MVVQSILLPCSPISELVQLLLPTSSDLEFEQIAISPDVITVAVSSTQASPLCPLCQMPATRVQSCYIRTLLDLPWATLSVRLLLTVRRFVCATDSCPRQIFTERLP